MKNEQIFLSKNFTIIESGIPFILRFNRKDSSASSAEDTIYMKSGWYIFDNNKLLPYEVEGVKNSPKYNAWVEYDESKLNELVQFRWYTSWVNPKSIESLNSDVYELDAVQFTDITDKINSIISKDEERNSYLSEISGDVDSLEANVSDIAHSATSLDSGTMLNELEQIRTVLKSSATAGNSTPWGSLLSSLGELKTAIERSCIVADKNLIWLEAGKDVRFFCYGKVEILKTDSDILHVVGTLTSESGVVTQCYGNVVSLGGTYQMFDDVSAVRVSGRVFFF